MTTQVSDDIFLFSFFKDINVKSITIFNVLFLKQILEFEVKMTCEGCSGAVNRVLSRNMGMSFDT